MDKRGSPSGGTKYSANGRCAPMLARREAPNSWALAVAGRSAMHLPKAVLRSLADKSVDCNFNSLGPWSEAALLFSCFTA